MRHSYAKTLQTYHHPLWLVTPKRVIGVLAVVALVMLIPATVSAVKASFAAVSLGSMSAAPVSAAALLRSENVLDRERAIGQSAQAARSGSRDAENQLAAFFQTDEFLVDHALSTGRALASIGSRSAYRTLIQGFQANQPGTRTMAAMAALEKANPSVVLLLIAALRDPDAGVRSHSAELLGFRHDDTAADALLVATTDADPQVRAAAVWAVGGDLTIWRALPRIELLQTVDSDSNVREVARLATDAIRSNVAWSLQLAPSDLLTVAVAATSGQVYAATRDELYALHESTTWIPVSRFPDVPTALAAGGPDGQLLYLGTVSAGPFRSHDGGQTWQSMRGGLPPAERLTVTALLIDPTTPSGEQVYMALAALVGTTESHTTPLGIFTIHVDGAKWLPVEAREAPLDSLTTRLWIDPSAPNELYGLTETGVWHTNLP